MINRLTITFAMKNLGLEHMLNFGTCSSFYLCNLKLSHDLPYFVGCTSTVYTHLWIMLSG